MRPISLILVLFIVSCTNHSDQPPLEIQQWTTGEIILTATGSYENPYTDVDVWTVFVNTERRKVSKGVLRTFPTDISTN